MEDVQTFSEYMRCFLREKRVKKVVEVGADPRLDLAARLARHCQQYVVVGFDADAICWQGWVDFHRNLRGVGNIEVRSGNATRLSELVPRAGVVLLQDVIIAPCPEDALLMRSYSRDGIEGRGEDLEDLDQRLAGAERLAFREFLRVADPGYVVRFGKGVDYDFKRLLIDALRVDPYHLEARLLLDDRTREERMAYIVDNTDRMMDHDPGFHSD